LAKSIGVSNYGPHHIDEVLAAGGVPPAVNQVRALPRVVASVPLLQPISRQHSCGARNARAIISQVELNPFITREALCTHCTSRGIVMEAYSPLTKGKKLGDPTVAAIGAAHGKSTAQVGACVRAPAALASRN
jgi:diketogulonate reductase-like aldo/keto reductase